MSRNPQILLRISKKLFRLPVQIVEESKSKSNPKKTVNESRQKMLRNPKNLTNKSIFLPIYPITFTNKSQKIAAQLKKFSLKILKLSKTQTCKIRHLYSKADDDDQAWG